MGEVGTLEGTGALEGSQRSLVPVVCVLLGGDTERSHGESLGCPRTRSEAWTTHCPIGFRRLDWRARARAHARVCVCVCLSVCLCACVCELMSALHAG